MGNPQLRPQVQQTNPVSRPASGPRQSAPKKKLSALQQILALQSKKGPTDAKNGGTPPPPTERPKPQRVMLFQEDNAAVPRTITGSEAFGVFEAVNLNSPSKTNKRLDYKRFQQFLLRPEAQEPKEPKQQPIIRNSECSKLYNSNAELYKQALL